MTTLADQLSNYVEAGGDQRASDAGREADYQHGIVLKGPWETFGDGFSEHTRRNARALALAGVPVALRSVAPKIRIAMGEELQIDEDYKDLLQKTIAVVDAQILQLVPTDGSLSMLTAHKFYSVAEQKILNGRKVFYTVWERFAGLQDDDRRALQSVGQVWVACQASKTFLVNEGLDESKVKVFPCPYLPNDPILKISSEPKKRNARPTFYHIGKWEPRKEQRNILGGFLLAFKPGECVLLIKTSEKAPYFDGYPTSIAVSIEEWLSDDRVKANGWTKDNLGKDVFAVTKRLSASQMTLLHKTSDCYVTLSRGEGFDMPAFDAKMAGNLMLYTPSGGPQDFAHAEDVQVEPSGLVDAHPFYRWVKGAKYLDYDMDAVASAYRIAAKKIRDGVIAKGDLAAFSAQSVGDGMAAAIRELGDFGF